MLDSIMRERLYRVIATISMIADGNTDRRLTYMEARKQAESIYGDLEETRKREDFSEESFRDALDRLVSGGKVEKEGDYYRINRSYVSRLCLELPAIMLECGYVGIVPGVESEELQ